MTWEEFGKEMERIEVVFMKSYTQETAQSYFEELKDVDCKIFQRVCEKIRHQFKPTYHEPLPVLSTILRHIDEIRYAGIYSIPDLCRPLTEEQRKKQSEINRKGKIKLAETILKLSGTDNRAKQWAKKVLERKGASTKPVDGPETLGKILEG